jgi:hypothetical protein
MIQTIITHPGSAHKDDVLAVSVLIAKYNAPVFRREPTEQELADPTIAIVDIGKEHEPQKSNFDHHHFPREHAPTCSLSLVLQHLGLYEDAIKCWRWLEPAEWLDSRGPMKTAEWLGVPRKAISQLNSPVDVTLLRRFGKKTTLEAGDPLYEFMRFVGQDLLDDLQLVRERIKFAKQNVEHWSIPCGDEKIQALYLSKEAGAKCPGGTFGIFRLLGGENIAVHIFPDNRSNGMSLFRVEDHPRVDFSSLEGEEKVFFAHPGGFIAKVDSNEPARLRELVVKAWK